MKMDLKKDSLALSSIMAAGGCVKVDAKSFDVLQLKSIASAGKTSGAFLIVENASSLDTLQCKGIASVNPGHVIFNFA